MHFDHNKTIGVLGTLIAAKWYRIHHPRHLLISLDSAEARKWMNLEEDAKRADLLGLSIESNRPFVDVLEVKSGEDARSVYRITEQGILTGRPVEQLLNTGKSVSAIFGLNDLKDHILTPYRREILRTHLYRQGFSATRSPKEKQEWGDLLNTLFSGQIVPAVRLHLIVVNLNINQEPFDRVLPTDREEIRLLHLNEAAVHLHLGGHSTSPERPPPSAPEPAAPTVRSRKEKPATVPASEPLVRPNLREEVEQTCRRLRAACQDFGIRVLEIDPEKVDTGPSVLRYKILLAPGEQGEKLRKQAENLARQLAATTVPIIDFLRGTNYMHLDLARPDREVVPIEPLLKSHRIENPNELPLHVGVDPAGAICRLDLGDDRLPHLLVAGGTGSGKTIFLYNVVLSLVAAHREQRLELAIIDPKQTDFTIFQSLPHLREGEIISDAERGVEVLQSIAEDEMAQRSEILQRARCRDIKTYNLDHPEALIRPLVVIIDEYADLVTVLPKKEREEFDRVISRLAARGRNVGLHLVVATQRPTADVVTGNIKANMPCRISFSLPSSRDSLVILDEPGAERLLRNGDMLLRLEGPLTRLQGYFVDPKRIPELLASFVAPSERLTNPKKRRGK